jgi:hypothetical protein
VEGETVLVDSDVSTLLVRDEDTGSGSTAQARPSSERESFSFDILRSSPVLVLVLAHTSGWASVRSAGKKRDAPVRVLLELGDNELGGDLLCGLGGEGSGRGRADGGRTLALRGSFSLLLGESLGFGGGEGSHGGVCRNGWVGKGEGKGREGKGRRVWVNEGERRSLGGSET